MLLIWKSPRICGLRLCIQSKPGTGPKFLKLVVVAFLLGTQDYGNSTMTVRPVSGYWTG